VRYILIVLIALGLFQSGCDAESEKRVIIKTDNAPEAIGPYSQAVLIDNTLYLAGQIPLDPDSGKMVNGGIEPQTQQVMKNIQEVLHAAGFAFDDVVQVQIFLTDLNHYSVVNKIYATYFRQEPPARAVVEVKRLPKDSLIEILVTARR
jgi:2-iminobutanoate/2-iminopropanoate deaminase